MRQHSRQLPVNSKAILRRELRSKRANLSPHLRESHDEAIRQHILQLVNSHNIKSVAAYWSFNGEPDITPVCRQLMASGCELALPVIPARNDHSMKFYSWRAETTLAKNWYGIFEPQEPISIPISDFDMLIMPLVGYDLLGNRLGMGGGYYDRHLESLRDSQTPLRVGVAYKLQQIDTIEKNDWDIPLHGVVNEHGWFTFDE